MPRNYEWIVVMLGTAKHDRQAVSLCLKITAWVTKTVSFLVPDNLQGTRYNHKGQYS